MWSTFWSYASYWGMVVLTGDTPGAQPASLWSTATADGSWIFALLCHFVAFLFDPANMLSWAARLFGWFASTLATFLPSPMDGVAAQVNEFMTGSDMKDWISIGLWFGRPFIDPTLVQAELPFVVYTFLGTSMLRIVMWAKSLFWTPTSA